MGRKSKNSVGIIGLGIIGSRIAAALRSRGWHVCVWNRTPLPAPCFLGSPGEVAALCDAIQLFVADRTALMDVLKALAPSLSPRHTIICNATVGKEATLEAAAFVAQTGASFLDAPFTGSKMAAEKGALVYYVGGEESVIKKVEPLLQASSKAIVRVGAIGDAAVLKIATNMMVGISVQALSEAIAVVRAAGVAPEKLVEAVEHHAVRSGLTDMKIASMIQGDFTPHFATKHMRKDLLLALQMASSSEVNLPATALTAELLQKLTENGAQDLDYSALMTLSPSAATPHAPAFPAERKEIALSAPDASEVPATPAIHSPAPGETREPTQSLEAEVVSQTSLPDSSQPVLKGQSIAQRLRTWMKGSSPHSKEDKTP